MRLSRTFLPAGALALVAAMAAPLSAHADSGIIRHAEGDFPISTAIEVPAGASTVYLSGMGAPVQDKSAPAKSLEAYGDTQTQTLASLKRIEEELKKLNLTMGDVVQMHIYMVADPRTKQLDFGGMMKAYTQYFGTAKQPNLPVRSAFAVAQLANPGWLIEIEVTAVRAPKK
ncbi:endoribonuclease L-PSP [Acetobacter indonesiensis NRIC 0313]|uniref:Endoribonuclease L-PSP n=1 Tax=Acetobacter indonesiensis TaxID=104101 RepID=A0A252ATE7_9PROT|nr:endoribonuclease L-PSP [Acetobacter indonesiensis]GBQ58138.1 endoribonuclease L-PSP [Acetobacter indonesiensis NRIC 0313]